MNVSFICYCIKYSREYFGQSCPMVWYVTPTLQFFVRSYKDLYNKAWDFHLVLQMSVRTAVEDYICTKIPGNSQWLPSSSGYDWTLAEQHNLTNGPVHTHRPLWPFKRGWGRFRGGCVPFQSTEKMWFGSVLLLEKEDLL